VTGPKPPFTCIDDGGCWSALGTFGGPVTARTRPDLAGSPLGFARSSPFPVILAGTLRWWLVSTLKPRSRLGDYLGYRWLCCLRRLRGGIGARSGVDTGRRREDDRWPAGMIYQLVPRPVCGAKPTVHRCTCARRLADARARACREAAPSRAPRLGRGLKTYRKFSQSKAGCRGRTVGLNHGR